MGWHQLVSGCIFQVLTHADENCPLPLLRNAHPLRVTDPTRYAVAAGFQRRQDFKEVTLGRSFDQPADIFRDENFWLQSAQQPDVLIEQCFVALARAVFVFLFLAPSFFTFASG